jgi:probable rRNA maturation factor
MGLGQARLEIELTGDREIARLNASFLGCVGPTNVLSFEDEDPEEDRLGHIVLSVEALQREAILYGQDRQEHFLRLLTHGLLHVAGFEHGEPMYALTDQAVLHCLAQLREGKTPLQE